MKLLILTSDTYHHNYFVRNLLRNPTQVSVIYETGIVIPPYKTYHHFQCEQMKHERRLWGRSALTIEQKEVSSLRSVANINDIDANDQIIRSADACIVFGTRKISKGLIGSLPKLTANLHGGDPELYRGLDSHLWSIWHEDKRGLKTCLHMVEPSLDSGKIIGIEELDLKGLNFLHELRALNTEACLKLAQSFVDKVNSNSELQMRQQTAKGRYYSFMPSGLKEVVVRKFNKFL